MTTIIKSQTEVKSEILELMKVTLSDEETGKLPPGFEDSFEDFQTDHEGHIYLQTIAGLVSIMKNETNVHYSPNFGYHAEQIAIETSNICKLCMKAGWDFIVNPGHFVDPTGKLLTGTNAYRAHRYYEEQMILQRMRELAKEKEQEKAPSIILPNDGKILTR